MGSSTKRKPAFGYPSQTAAMWAFIDQGDTLEEIAGKFGMPRANVRCHLGYKGGRFFPKRPGKYLVDESGALHPCRSSSFVAVALLVIRPNAINETTTADMTTADRAGGCEGRAPEGPSGTAVGVERPPANARQPRTPRSAALKPVARAVERPLRPRAKVKVSVSVETIARPVQLPPAPVPADGFTLAASDDPGAKPSAWCGQCELRRTRQQAANCSSLFCRLQERVRA